MTSIRELTIGYFTNLPLLSITGSREIVDYVCAQNPSVEEASIRTELQKLTLGLRTSLSANPPVLYAVHARIDSNQRSVYLTLAGGISRQYFDRMSNKFTRAVRLWLCFSSRNASSAAYSSKILDYWVHAKQLRSVDIIPGKVKDDVKKRANNRCQICQYLNVTTTTPLRISHIVSRKSLFWYAVALTHKAGHNLFSDQGVDYLNNLFSAPTMLNRLHNSPDYLAYLCTEHDTSVQKVIRNYAITPLGLTGRGWIGRLLGNP